MERKLLVALLRSWLKEKLEELGRKIGSVLEGTDLSVKDVRPLMLELLGEAFGQLEAEYEAKLLAAATKK